MPSPIINAAWKQAWFLIKTGAITVPLLHVLRLGLPKPPSSGWREAPGVVMSDWPYNSILTSRVQELRKNPTNQERRLWYNYLRDYRPRFTRQRIVGNYILDFYCAEAKLAVELDGLQHFEEDGIEYNRIRTMFLESLGIRVLRFANTDVDCRFEGVCDAIDAAVGGSNPRPCGPPPSEEGGFGRCD